MNTIQIPTEKRLLELGFVTAASEMQKHKAAAPKQLREKLRIAFEHFRVVEPHHIERFNKLLKSQTRKLAFKWRSRHETLKRYSYKVLSFTTIHCYPAAPPEEVLVELEKAKALECFDWFEVCTIELRYEEEYKPRMRLPDPILFGRITGSDNRYFITQWDDDIRIEQILKEDEG